MIKCDICDTSDNNLQIIKTKKFNICESCVKTAYEILWGPEEKQKLNAVNEGDLDKVIAHLNGLKEEEGVFTPKEINSRLEEYVIGQIETKKVLSVAVYNHFQRINNIKGTDIVFDKSNALLIGPSGSGKTLLAKTIAKTFNVPIVITDATSLTQAGFAGDDVEGILTRLVADADGDIAKAERGIIFIDEIDKIAKRFSPNTTSGKDGVGEGVQHALLKIIEGTDVSFPLNGSRKTNSEPTGVINTENILFICSGAFSGLSEVIEKRLTKNKRMGFSVKEKEGEEKTVDPKEILSEVEIDDLIAFGFVPEFLGRLPIVSTLKELTEEELYEVLTVPKNSIIKQYKELLKLDQVELSFEEEALRAIVDICIENKTGVRNLKATIEKIMLNIMYNIEEYRHKSVSITEAYINNNNLSDLVIAETLIFNEPEKEKATESELTNQ